MKWKTAARYLITIATIVVSINMKEVPLFSLTKIKANQNWTCRYTQIIWVMDLLFPLILSSHLNLLIILVSHLLVKIFMTYMQEIIKKHHRVNNIRCNRKFLWNTLVIKVLIHLQAFSKLLYVMWLIRATCYSCCRTKMLLLLHRTNFKVISVFNKYIESLINKMVSSLHYFLLLLK